MLIDSYLSTFSASERHAIRVRAPMDAVYRAIRSADLARALPVRLLLGLRALPGVLLRSSGRTVRPQLALAPITLAEFERAGFAVLAEDPPNELLIGLVGSFWRLGGGIRRTDAEQFQGPQPHGTARAAWNFSLCRDGDGVRLTTETRIQAADPDSARKLRIYWLFIRPWSGLVRRYMLRAIRAEAEGRARS